MSTYLQIIHRSIILKVYLNKYRNHWLSPYTIMEKALFWKRWTDPDFDLYDDANAHYTDWLLKPCEMLQKFLDVVHPKIDYVKIDRWDTWSMDHTLSLIALPMLRQLQASKHGAPYVDDADVPEHLRSTTPGARDGCEEEWDLDGHHFKRWDWIMDEMIFAHASKVDDTWQDKYWTGEWGKTLWTKTDREYPNPETGKMEATYQMDNTGDRTCDWDGLKKEQERIDNGFRLFGKYYSHLWD